MPIKKSFIMRIWFFCFVLGCCILPIAAYGASAKLLLSEVVVTPTYGEFIEIFNPNGAPVNLSDYYLADFNTYFLITQGAGSPGSSSDFNARFPTDSWIAPLGYATIALQNATIFNTTYGIFPTYDMDPSDSNAQSMTGSIGSSAGLTNSGEMAILYHWDGVSAVVTDIDYLLYGDADDAVDKTGYTGYLPDTAVGSQIFSNTATSGNSITRVNFTEGTQLFGGGNGLWGLADETSENLDTTWEVSSSITPMNTPPPSVPIPGALWLLGSGLVGLAGARRKFKK